MNLTSLDVDIEPELPVSKETKSKYGTSSNRKRSNKRKANTNSLRNILKNDNRINARLKKKLKSFDAHHLDSAITFIVENNLHSLKVNKREGNIPRLCVDCNKCIKALNYCTVWKQNCTTLHNLAHNKLECNFKTKIK